MPDLQVPRPFQRKGKLAHTFWAMESLSAGIVKVLVDSIVQKSEYKVTSQSSDFRIQNSEITNKKLIKNPPPRVKVGKVVPGHSHWSVGCLPALWPTTPLPLAYLS